MHALLAFPAHTALCAQGRSEQFLGRWLREARCRDRVLISTKVAGPAAMPWLRDGPLRQVLLRILQPHCTLTRPVH
jgi:aryl-alcohol dehydrogenase-like predicted oxidoreductase